MKSVAIFKTLLVASFLLGLLVLTCGKVATAEPTQKPNAPANQMSQAQATAAVLDMLLPGSDFERQVLNEQKENEEWVRDSKTTLQIQRELANQSPVQKNGTPQKKNDTEYWDQAQSAGAVLDMIMPGADFERDVLRDLKDEEETKENMELLGEMIKNETEGNIVKHAASSQNMHPQDFGVDPFAAFDAVNDFGSPTAFGDQPSVDTRNIAVSEQFTAPTTQAHEHGPGGTDWL